MPFQSHVMFVDAFVLTEFGILNSLPREHLYSKLVPYLVKV